MKKLTVVFVTMFLFASSCNEDEVVPRRSNEELAAITLEKVTANQTVLKDVFAETANKVTRAAIQNALKTSSTKEAFITTMNALVEEVFENEVEANSEQMASDVFIKFGGVEGDAVKETVGQFILDPASEDPLVNYSNKVKSLLDDAQASGRSILILVEKVVAEETSEAAPADEVSLNFEKMKVMYEMHNRIIMSENSVSAETENEIEGILAQEGIPPVAIALLVPAVQKVRECCTAHTTSTPYWDWLLDFVSPEINGGLNRDILRRYNAAGFMGAMQFLLSDEYKNDDQDLASMLLLRARYQASLMFIWSDIWEKSKLAEVMMGRVRSNENILEDAFEETAKLITRKAIIDARAASADKAEFIANMNELVEDVFDREVQKKSEAYAGGVSIAVGDLNGDGTSSYLAELLINNDVNPLNSFASLIQTAIDKRSMQDGNTGGDLNLLFTIVDRVTQNGTEKRSYMSIAPDALSDAKTIKDAVLAGRNAGADPDQVIEGLRVQYNIPQPLMGMLLPAVQKVRDYNGTTETADTAYLQWLKSLNPMAPNGVGHDAAAKYDAAGYLGALQLFVSDKYRGDNEDYASLLLLKARYQASLTMIFNDLWDK